MLGARRAVGARESGLLTIAGGLGGSESGDNGLPGANVALEKAVHGGGFLEGLENFLKSSDAGRR